jgi:hypothetical protein
VRREKLISFLPWDFLFLRSNPIRTGRHGVISDLAGGLLQRRAATAMLVVGSVAAYRQAPTFTADHCSGLDAGFEYKSDLDWKEFYLTI